MNECSKCGKRVKKSELCVVDDNHICVQCMYGNTQPITIYPIGVVKNNAQLDNTRFGITKKNDLSRIVLIPSQEPFLYKLEEEEYVTIIYYLHKSWAVKSVFERGYDGKRVGVFATRTPHRLSRLALQDVRLIKIEGTMLYVEGLDAIDGSPVLDIKMKWSSAGK